MYEQKYKECITSGLSIYDAIIAITEIFLDGKPRSRGKHKIKVAERNAAFWSSLFLKKLSSDIYNSEPFILALARYLEQEKTTNFDLILHIAKVSPESIYRAVRYSGIVLRQHSKKWQEIEKLALIRGGIFNELIQICHTFKNAHQERTSVLESYKKLLVNLTPLELLSYASLYAFEHIVHKYFPENSQKRITDSDKQEIWYAINELLVWKLKTCDESVFYLTDEKIGSSLGNHLSPFLFPSAENIESPSKFYQAFGQLIEAQVELDSFLSQSVDAFCYDDSIRFVLVGTNLEIIECYLEARDAWRCNGEKLLRLHNYWFYKAVYVFYASDWAKKPIGRLENQEANRLAVIQAFRSQLQLTDVYGLDETVLVEKTGLQVDLFQALLSLELMTTFYNVDFILPYKKYLDETGNWQFALSRLAMEGLLTGSQNRFPITWSDRKSKIKNISAWTVSKKFPQGNLKAAEAILDFWTSDLKDFSFQLKNNESILNPEFSELPILKMGRYLFQLPWMQAFQNNSSAAINNLRRLGSHRKKARKETACIEQRLAKCFEERDFQVCLNYEPIRTKDENAGEVDIICVKDGQLLVLEVKSTFLRKSQKDAWRHKINTLRKAGLQLQRKVKAVEIALLSDHSLVNALCPNNEKISVVHGWIVDTSIEHDHELFSGFLKVSLEEILIALRDDSYFLNDPAGIFSGEILNEKNKKLPEKQTTLYPNGFSGEYFVNVIKQQTVWKNLAV
ncbi:MAG: hypothetical protein VSS75_021010 [Candidatus Parabeggiatoa sp.]|nr:hypothetical protein [Candidatus Parabeggiatoa sp.]